MIPIPTTYKILGQSNPAATTETRAYYVPSSTSAVVSSIAICNMSSSAATYRIAVKSSGGSANTAATAAPSADWFVYGATVAGSDTTVLTVGLTLQADAQIRVYASTANLSFSIYGSEITP